MQLRIKNNYIQVITGIKKTYVCEFVTLYNLAATCKVLHYGILDDFQGPQIWQSNDPIVFLTEVFSRNISKIIKNIQKQQSPWIQWGPLLLVGTDLPLRVLREVDGLPMQFGCGFVSGFFWGGHFFFLALGLGNGFFSAPKPFPMAFFLVSR